MVPNELPPAPHSPPVEGCGPAPEPNAQPRERLPRPTECSVSLDAEARAACMLALSAVATDGELLLLAASADHLDGLEPSLTAARSAVGGQLLIVATDEIARARADALGIAWWYLPTPSVHLPATHWRAAANGSPPPPSGTAAQLPLMMTCSTGALPQGGSLQR